MFLQQTHITSAMSLTPAAVTVALRKNYPQDTVKTAKFLGMTCNGSFVYDCTYSDESDFDVECYIYVQFDNKGRMSACY